MENLYYYIIIFAIIIEYLLSSVSSILDIKNITPTIPSDFKKAYDQEKYILSQDYLKARTRFGLFSTIVTLMPNCDARIAATYPPGPPPMTVKSYISSIFFTP